MSTTTRRALSMPDVLDEIFEFFDQDTFSSAFRERTLDYQQTERLRTRTLAHAARVCRVFHAPAIRILWRVLNSVDPICALFPSPSSHNRSDPNQGTRPPSDSHAPTSAAHEWDRFQTYAIHVRALTHDGTEPERSIVQRWPGIQTFAGGPPLLPNLVWIDWRIDLHDINAILPFISPTLEVLDFRCPLTTIRPTPEVQREWEKNLASLTNQIYERVSSPSVLYLSIGDLAPSTVVAHMPGYESLRRFDLSSTADDAAVHSPDDLHTLARMPALEALKFPSFQSIPTWDAFEPAPFKNLKFLVLGSCTPDCSLFSCPSLETLDIQRYIYRDAPTLRRSFERWARCFPRLEEFDCEIDIWRAPDLDRSAPALAWAVAPLFAVASLRSVALGYAGNFPVDDAALRAFAHAWPALSYLSILYNTMNKAYPGFDVGLPGLLALKERCPRLATLRLPRVHVRPEEVPPLPLDRSDHGLQTLVAGVDETSCSVLRDVFPHAAVVVLA